MRIVCLSLIIVMFGGLGCKRKRSANAEIKSRVVHTYERLGNGRVSVDIVINSSVALIGMSHSPSFTMEVTDIPTGANFWNHDITVSYKMYPGYLQPLDNDFFYNSNPDGLDGSVDLIFKEISSDEYDDTYVNFDMLMPRYTIDGAPYSLSQKPFLSDNGERYSALYSTTDEVTRKRVYLSRQFLMEKLRRDKPELMARSKHEVHNGDFNGTKRRIMMEVDNGDNTRGRDARELQRDKRIVLSLENNVGNSIEIASVQNIYVNSGKFYTVMKPFVLISLPGGMLIFNMSGFDELEKHTFKEYHWRTALADATTDEPIKIEDKEAALEHFDLMTLSANDTSSPCYTAIASPHFFEAGSEKGGERTFVKGREDSEPDMHKMRRASSGNSANEYHDQDHVVPYFDSEIFYRCNADGNAVLGLEGQETQKMSLGVISASGESDMDGLNYRVLRYRAHSDQNKQSSGVSVALHHCRLNRRQRHIDGGESDYPILHVVETTQSLCQQE